MCAELVAHVFVFLLLWTPHALTPLGYVPSVVATVTAVRPTCVHFAATPLQGYVRKAGAYLTATKQLDALTSGNGSRWWQFAQDMGVVQHHDAVAGTEKQHVAYDYAKRIAEGVTAGEGIVNGALATLMNKQGSTVPVSSSLSLSPLCLCLCLDSVMCLYLAGCVFVSVYSCLCMRVCVC